MTFGVAKPDGKTLTEKSGVTYDTNMNTEDDLYEEMASILAKIYEIAIYRARHPVQSKTNGRCSRLSKSKHVEAGSELLETRSTEVNP